MGIIDQTIYNTLGSYNLFYSAPAAVEEPLPIVPPVDMKFSDWLAFLSGLLSGVSLCFALLYCFTVSKLQCSSAAAREKVFTATNIWLVLSGVIHFWVEGSFVFFRTDSFIKTGMDYYASGDLRYNHPMEPGTKAMEAITAVLEGPMCLLIAYGHIMKASWRHPLQLVITTCQIYGLVWFILHPMCDPKGHVDHITSDTFLFWFLVVGMNAPWGIVPPLLFYQSYRHIVQGLQKVEKVSENGNKNL